MKPIKIHRGEIHNIIQNPAWHEAILDKESVVELSMCCILINSLRIDQNTKDKENPDNTDINKEDR